MSKYETTNERALRRVIEALEDLHPHCEPYHGMHRLKMHEVDEILTKCKEERLRLTNLRDMMDEEGT